MTCPKCPDRHHLARECAAQESAAQGRRRQRCGAASPTIAREPAPEIRVGVQGGAG
jgi:hypothetical protein